MEFKGTKGEWCIEYHDVGAAIGREDLDYQIADVYGYNHSECKANAKLIAAAPNLLESLQRWVKFADSQNLNYESSMVRESKKAIEKALS